MGIPTELIERFDTVAEELETRYAGERLEDGDTNIELRTWIDGSDSPLSWTEHESVTSDEWFFISTLYGEMTVDGQRTHIRKYYPSLFIGAAGRDMRNFVPDMTEYEGLRSRWMSGRLSRMGGILRDREESMENYTTSLRLKETAATPENPMPALDTIIRDHRATGWKTLSVFVRDCVKGNSFPIDSRVEKELHRHSLPVDERQLISLSLAIGRSPRKLARMFYMAGGAST